MKTTTAIIRIKDQSDVTISYDTLENLSQKIWNLLFDLNYQDDYGSVTVEYEPTKVVNWNFSIAHYCFAHGEVSESDFARICFLNENPWEDAK